MTKLERLEKEFQKTNGALDVAEVKAKEAREAVLLAIESGEGVSLARSREEDAKAAVTQARREASDVAEVLRKARDEEEKRLHAEEVAALTAEAQKYAAAAEAGLKAGAAQVAAGLVVCGKALLDSSGSELAGDALEGVKAPRAGRGRFYPAELTDAVNAALEAAYTRPNLSGSAWVEEIGPLRVVVARCEAGKK
jgi:hypothetical protein